MKNFHDFYFGMSASERQEWVAKVGTSIGYAERVAGGFKLPSLTMALRMARASKGRINVASIVETYENRHGPLA